MELEDLVATYSRLKPQYDKRKAGYDSRLRTIREQYQNMLDDRVWLETVEKNIKELQQEKMRLVSENKIIEKEVKQIKEEIKGLEAERSTRPKLTGENLIMFLLLTHYMRERGVEELNEISIRSAQNL
jgi:predicted nuclease with TOPRIM domain